MSLRTWLVTGASRGLGRAFAEAALEAGDAVVATARRTDALADLVRDYPDRACALELDVTNRRAAGEVVGRALDVFGRIDVLVNNAGYLLFGAVEEVTEDEIRRQFDVNVFGAIWCTQAVLPVMRDQRRGHIFQISSMGAIGPLLGTGMYSATKCALEGFSESLAQEVAGFGITVTIVEPGRFPTSWNAESMTRAQRLAAYEEVLRSRRVAISETGERANPGDLEKAARALLTVLESEAPPLRLLLGNAAADAAPSIYRSRLDEWARWEPLSRATDFDAT